ncbi:SDR family NAD(P)-dependent oxidoreductase [Shouchella sp. JSM 1781072]|uniref:SDR family NAD(P)-dependent oxidoreductase n=1 Tax=Shouchella sp. JSM 1781072 TaxID=3344581 RepID=UPI0035C135AB
MNAPLKNKTAVVTGGARGIGFAFAHRLASLGARIAVLDLELSLGSSNSNKTITDDLIEKGANAVGYEVDVTDKQAVHKCVRDVANQFGTIDILVANAGGGSGALDENAAAEIDPEHLKLVMERNLFGTMHCVSAVAPMMKKQKSGKIVTMASITGLVANPSGTYAHYAATKAALVSYTKNLAQDLGPYQIQVNGMAPGYIGTKRLLERFREVGVEQFENQTALRRLGTPEDCANVLEFLVTPLSDYVTGTIIDVTGGALR